jgi:hypothetical protein
VRPQFLLTAINALLWRFKMNSLRIFSIRSAWICASLLPLAVAAQTQPSSVANSRATVPAVEYRSVFRETSLGIERDKLDWRKANDDVGKFTRGHVDILKQEEMESQKTTKPSAAPAHKH